jgi:Protein SET DOMAIN GROUP 2 C-terminal
MQEYKSVKSPAVYISPLDMGPKYTEKTGSMYTKTYSPNYILGQLIYWFSQTNADPDSRLARARKGCLTLPNISSFYTKSSKNVRERVYGTRTVRFMLSRMVYILCNETSHILAMSLGLKWHVMNFLVATRYPSVIGQTSGSENQNNPTGLVLGICLLLPLTYFLIQSHLGIWHWSSIRYGPKLAGTIV